MINGLYSREGIDSYGTCRKWVWCRVCETYVGEEDYVIFFGGHASCCHECQQPLYSRVYTPICDMRKYLLIARDPDRKPDPLVSRDE